MAKRTKKKRARAPRATPPESASDMQGVNDIDEAVAFVRSVGSATFNTAELDALAGAGESRSIIAKLEEAVSLGRETVTLSRDDVAHV